MTAGLPFDRADASRAWRWALLALWAAVAGYLIAHHVPWRDEVRALSLATDGADWAAMLRGVRGEGHPALWYLLLRAAHDVAETPLVLPAVAAAVGLASAALFALAAPLRGWTIALVLAGYAFVFDYTVSARNYGISMLLLFAVAALPARRGVLVGLCLAALANTNVGAVIAAAAVLLFRGVELLTREDADREDWRALLVASALAAVGVALCFMTVYPPVNDAATAEAGVPSLAKAIGAFVQPGYALYALAPEWLGHAAWVPGVFTLLLLAAPLSLLRTPGGFVAGLAGLFGFALFHALLYPGGYRHHALFLVLIVALHWMAARGGGGRWRRAPDARLLAAAQWLTVALFALQVPASVAAMVRSAQRQPYSNSARLAALLARPDLRDAVVIAEPDYLIEPLAYYRPLHPTWLIRERRWGRTVRYARDVRRDLTPADILAEARMLRARTRRPVVIALDAGIAAATGRVKDGYVTSFSSDIGQWRAFHAATRPIATLDGSESGEDYRVYILAH